jgi:hypothetical protein
MSEEMGFEQKLYIGTAGTTAATQVTNATDVDYDLQPEKGSTTGRGTGATVPIKTERVTQLGATVNWKMLNDPADAVLILMIAAAKTGAPLALKVTTKSGAVLFDGDCTLSKKHSGPLSGESMYDFTGTPTKEAGRQPILG